LFTTEPNAVVVHVSPLPPAKKDSSDESIGPIGVFVLEPVSVAQLHREEIRKKIASTNLCMDDELRRRGVIRPSGRVSDNVLLRVHICGH
jgi:hypothetical protein